MKKTIKKTILSITAMVALSTNSNAILGVGDIVYDPMAVAKAIEQVTQLKKQIEETKKLATANCGVKDAVKMYSDLKALTETMEKYKLTLDDLDLDDPKSQIGQMAQQLFEENQIFDNCNQPCNSTVQTEVCKNKQKRNVQEIATAMVYSDDLEKVSKRLQTLSKELAKSKDIKTSQDIGNAISLELAQLELSKTRVEMMAKANAAKCKADEDRLVQEQAKTGGTTSDTTGFFKH